jgi:hypothetical protein
MIEQRDEGEIMLDNEKTPEPPKIEMASLEHIQQEMDSAKRSTIFSGKREYSPNCLR